MVITKKFLERVVRSKMDIAVVVLCSLVFSSLVIKTHWFAYNMSARAKNEKPLVLGYDLISLGALDLIIAVLAGIIVGVFISDVKVVFYGYVGAILLSYIISTIYIFFYSWFILGHKYTLSLLPFGWEWAVLAAAITAFVLIFPVICLCLIGIIFGIFIKAWIGWS